MVHGVGCRKAGWDYKNTHKAIYGKSMALKVPPNASNYRDIPGCIYLEA